MVKLSLDIAQFKRELDKVGTMTKKAMDNIGKTTQNSASKFNDLENAVKELRHGVDKNFEKMENDVKDSTNQMAHSFDKGFSKMASIAKTAATAIVSALSIREIADFGKQAIEAAADLEAINAAFEQIFVDETGDYTKTATKHLEKMCGEWDMEINSLKDSYTSFAAQFKGLGMDMGTSMDEASIALSLAADAAAMFNIPLEDAITNIRSFVKGNAEGGESIQLFQSATMLGAYAVEKGIVSEADAFKDLSEAEKQLIRLDYAKYQYDLAGITGQATRESDMYVNQLSKLKRKWEDFKAVLGTAALEGVTTAFKGLGDAIDGIDAEALGEKLGGAIKKVANWLASIDWWLVGQQLETIWGYLKEFFSAAWDTLSETLSPVGDAISGIFGGFNEDVNTENMDSINAFLVSSKPIFEYLAEHGSEIADAIIDIGKAWATWKAISIGFTVTDWGIKLVDKLKTLTAGGLAGEIVEKGLGLDKSKGLGALLMKGLPSFITSGSVGTVAALTIPIAVALSFEYWGTEEQKEGVEERVNDRMGIQVGKKKHGKDKGKKLNDGENFNWKETKESWNKFWGDLLESETSFSEKSGKNLEELSEKYGIEFNKQALTREEVNSGTGTFWNSWLEKQNTGSSSIYSGMSEFTSSMSGEYMKQNNDRKGFAFNFDNDWNLLKDSQKNTQVTMTDNLRSYGGANLTEYNKQRGDQQGFKIDTEQMWNDITSSKFITKISEFMGGVKNAFSTWWTNVKSSCSDSWTIFKGFWNGIVDWFRQLPFRIANAFTGGGGTIGKSFEDVMNDALIKLNIKINSLIGTINSFFEKLGISTRIGSVTLGNTKQTYSSTKLKGNKMGFLATGTDNWQGGTALVGEAGREIVADPKLGTFMADNPMILNLSKGASVLSNPKTEKLLKSIGIKAYASGKNEGGFWRNVWDYVSNPSKVLENIFGSSSIEGSSFFAKAVSELLGGSIKQGVLEYLKKILGSDEVKMHPKNPLNAVADISGVEGWRDKVIQAAAFFGDVLTENEIARVLQQIRTESGGNQGVTQSMAVDDINSRTGNLAKGLLQYVPSTFAAYKVKGYENIWNGYHQLLAFFNNSTWRRALPQLGERRGWTPRGARRMATGGIVSAPTKAIIGEAGDEAVVPLTSPRIKPFSDALASSLVSEWGNSGSSSEQSIIINVPVYLDGKEIAAKTAPYTKAELDKMEHRNLRIKGKK